MSSGHNPYGQQGPYGQNPYGPSPHGQYPPTYGGSPYGNPYGAPSNGLGLAAMILGILSIPFGPFCIGAIAGIVAIVLGFIGRSRVGRGEATNGGQALAGIICGAVGLVVTIGLVALFVVLNSHQGSTYALTTAPR